MRFSSERASTRWPWMHAAWVIGLMPIILGLLVGGILGPWPLVCAAVCWTSALGCVLRMQTLRDRTSVQERLAALGWVLAALALIGASAVAMHALT